MNYKYTAQIPISIASCSSVGNEFISTASLEGLKPLLPSGIDFEANADLLGTAFNSAVVNQFNKNDDGILTDTAIECVKNFIHKPTNLEHNKDKVVGHIVNAAFSTYPDSQLIEVEDVIGSNEPFNISLAALVYSSVNPEFAEVLTRAMDPQDSLYQRVSASWEIGFSEIGICIGEGSITECEILYDSASVAKYRPYLKAYKGNGRTKDGKRVRRVITGKVYPLGIGYTVKPAADVKGVLTHESEKLTITDSKANKKNTKISQKFLSNVKNKKDRSMDLEQFIAKLESLLLEKKFSEESVASMTSTFTEAIKQKDVEYRKELEAVEKAKADAEKAHEELKASVETLKTQLGEAQTKIQTFETEQEAQKAVAKFNERMDVLDQEFVLEDSDREFLVKKLKTLDSSDEAFASFKEEMDIVWKSKNKEAKAALEAEIAQRVEAELKKRLETSNASEQEDKDNEEILDKTKASEEGPTNNNQSASENEPSLRDKFKSAFSRENITIE